MIIYYPAPLPPPKTTLPKTRLTCKQLSKLVLADRYVRMRVLMDSSRRGQVVGKESKR